MLRKHLVWQATEYVSGREHAKLALAHLLGFVARGRRCYVLRQFGPRSHGVA